MNRLYARHQLDIRPAHLRHAVAALAISDAAREARELERLWLPDGSALACYSVRSGFHLLLTALELPRGSEVLFSAVTHPDMPRIAEHHGLVPVPVDLDPATMAPTPVALARSIGEKSRVFVVAHLFGGHADMGPLADLCRANGLLLVEDCAQAYQGPPDTGDERAALSMFSFGILKTATALGGALLTVRDERLLARMRSIQLGWPLQKRSLHAKRIAQTAGILSMTRPMPYTALARAMGSGFDRFVNTSVKAFPAGATAELVRRLEQRPGAPLLNLMAHRLENFDHARLLARTASGESLAAMLPDGLHVGGAALDHSHWLFPVVTDRPVELIAAARAIGLDAARSASSVKAIAAPEGRPELEPERARRVMSRLVFLPAYPELPAGTLDALAEALEEQERIHEPASR
jgi:dTDP-4-amino-4,6-dideoxygalactose transaminase